MDSKVKEIASEAAHDLWYVDEHGLTTIQDCQKHNLAIIEAAIEKRDLEWEAYLKDWCWKPNATRASEK